MTNTTTPRIETRTPAASTTRIPWIVAAVVVFCWGVNVVLAKHALNQFDVGPFNFVRFTGMVALGWLVLLLTGSIEPVATRDVRRFGTVAVVGFCGYIFGFSIALSLISAFSASLLLALVPIWVVVLSAVTERRAPSRASVMALLIAAAGTALFIASRTSVSVGWGDLIALATAACYAGYLILNRSLVARYSPITLTTYAASVAAVPILALTAPTLTTQEWTAITTSGWLAMAWVIIGPVFLAWSAWSWVQRHLAATQIAPLLFLVPIISGLTAWIVLDESISPGQIIGTAAVIAGLVLNSRAAKTTTP